MERVNAGGPRAAALSSHSAEDGSRVRNPLKLVLDTNVAIDWLVFDHPYLTALRDGIRGGAIVILTHPLVFEELQRVLAYRVLKLDEGTRRRVLERYALQSASVRLPDGLALDRSSLPKNFPRCRDRDDDLFLALAYHASASALVSRDKAVLKLKRRAARFGLEILNVQELIEQRLAGRAC